MRKYIRDSKSNADYRTVIQIADFGAPYSGNFIASLLALEGVLKKAGLRQVLILSEKAKDKAWLAKLYNNNVSVHLLPKNASPFYLAKEISRIALIEKAIILHTHFTRFDVPAWLAGILMRMKKKTPCIVWHVHSNFPIKHTLARLIKDTLKLRLMGRSVEMITVSEELRRSYAAMGFTKTVQVVPNGIDLIRATTVSKSKREMRKELGISKNTVLLLSFGWDPITKGIDLLIEAANKLSAEMKFNLLIIGEDRLKEFIAKQFGEILPSWLLISEPKENVADLYTAADIFISASRWEGCPYSVMEAMANGLPIISSDIPALEWARPAEGVVFFEPYNSQELAQTIKKVIYWSPQKLANLAESNHKYIRTGYSVNAWAQNIYNIYERLLKDRQ
jgi:glycosyltransferase involved in cell wall biosynthesis